MSAAVGECAEPTLVVPEQDPPNENILCDGLPQLFPIAATLFERAGGTPTDSFVSLHLKPLMGMVRRSAAVSGYQESHHAYEPPP